MDNIADIIHLSFLTYLLSALDDKVVESTI